MKQTLFMIHTINLNLCNKKMFPTVKGGWSISLCCFSEYVSLQNESGWGHGTADSTQSKAETAAGTTGIGSLVHSLFAGIQGNPQICSLQLHSAVWCSAARQMDNLFHGGKVMINCCRENTLDLELINEIDQQPLHIFVCAAKRKRSCLNRTTAGAISFSSQFLLVENIK